MSCVIIIIIFKMYLNRQIHYEVYKVISFINFALLN